MSDKIIKKEEFPQFLKALKKTYEVFVPVEEEGFHRFKSLTDGE